MLKSVPQKIYVCVIALLFNATAYSLDDEINEATLKKSTSNQNAKSTLNPPPPQNPPTPHKPNPSSTIVPKPENTTAPKPDGLKIQKETAPLVTSIKEPTRAEKMASRFLISSGFGWIRAYKSIRKGSLGGNGLADVKVSYLTNKTFFDGKKLYATFRYLPFNISTASDVNEVQEYSGNLNTYALGAELLLSTSNKIDYLASAEAGFYHTHLSEIIPVTESNAPIKKIGGLLIAGAELRYKPLEKLHIGSRLYFGGGNISFVSFLFNASFYF
jgi:hypothetical protein